MSSAPVPIKAATPERSPSQPHPDVNASVFGRGSNTHLEHAGSLKLEHSWRRRSPALAGRGPEEFLPAFTVFPSQASLRQGDESSNASGVATPWRRVGDIEQADAAASLNTPLLAGEKIGKEIEAQLTVAYSLSWVVNILLFGAKGYAWWLSGSKAVLASLMDSFVDLVSQGVIFFAEWKSRKADPRFPVGQARLETIGVLACAVIMAVASYAVIQESVITLFDGFFHDELPEMDTSILMYAVLGTATLLKLACYVVCVRLAHRSDSMVALAEDHLNDIMSNVGAAATAAIAGGLGEWTVAPTEKTWWVDPAGAIAISALILYRWMDIAKAQVFKIVGCAAPEDLVSHLTVFANAHHANLEVDCIRAYHFGARFIVEMEVIMPISSTLKEVHDISLELQNRLEALEPVERAFVHVDYEHRDLPEHRTERLLAGLPVLQEETLSSSSHSSP